MDFSRSEEQQAIAELAAQVIGDASTHERLRQLETADGPRFDRELWAQLAATGILGVNVAEQHGGAGLDLVALGGVLEQAGRCAAAVPLWETLGLGVAPIVATATSELAAEVLPAVVDGDLVLTAAWHEDGGDPLAPTTVAERSGDGGWQLTGSKTCVPAGAIADAFVVPAAIEGGSVGLFLVRRSAEGVAIEPLDTTAGDPQAAVLFAMSPAELVGEGYTTLAAALDVALATQCALATGVVAESLRLTAEYAKDRKQFDVPIASFQAVAHRAADAFVDTEAIRLTSLQALWRLSVGMPASAEVAAAKYWVALAGQRVVHTGQHLHGGVGVDRDYPLHRYFLAAKQIELQLGGATQQLLRLGDQIANEPV